ncbi:hypothetical protein A2954_05105 [Candidatus Roizmanbacteria bacterium RIFCSPLOWO2_01_FULL_37_12]|uniref:DDH domain-containing protein n=1 Tax=Candidatus Roizmanbacteria bacterium RIFCSPLOWO2_01_FULL_37_12 TaxID=1802056 RepID=A0A1F7I8U5_9BACT|nr:MAG: hypothetical protein A2768_02200 [Candidatus Roizmanbacteria bacterium RIFCSPHIGHO2_01_FULL_37_16]OGK23731.1 MAG: hypothetical protein A3D76_04150 [Candidatus Roizmanbacteria bacterium RIFCSPHIGHO2_02_FULL_37_9b]OGK39773.1 MAG: hypothetical protein A2954_05105 [Candidatus Roizmanbacteria bacterium RIFCSPLOWO2_01_FULL_37_12]
MNNNIAQTLTHLNDVIQKGNSGVITLPSNPSVDAVAASTALYLGLHKMGKSVSLASASKPTYSLTATDKIQAQLTTSGDDLVISFPYSEGAVDKVDYNIQGNNFNLIITPRQGFPKLDTKQVKYSYAGGVLNFVITIDAPTLNSLGELYTSNEKQFQGKDIINIDRHLTNSFFGSVNYVNKTSSSISEMVLKLLQSLGVEIDRDMATNLYAGIAASTNNFSSYSVTADTFEAVATLLRLGAVKKTIGRPPQPRGFQPQPQMNPSFNSPQPSQFPQPRFNNQPDMVTPIEQVEKEPKGADAQTPQDWLKPKIFKGGGGLV